MMIMMNDTVIIRTARGRMEEWLINDEFGGIWKEAAVA
jgi:hypothetical protein